VTHFDCAIVIVQAQQTIKKIVLYPTMPLQDHPLEPVPLRLNSLSKSSISILSQNQAQEYRDGAAARRTEHDVDAQWLTIDNNSTIWNLIMTGYQADYEANDRFRTSIDEHYTDIIREIQLVRGIHGTSPHTEETVKAEFFEIMKRLGIVFRFLFPGKPELFSSIEPLNNSKPDVLHKGFMVELKHPLQFIYHSQDLDTKVQDCGGWIRLAIGKPRISVIGQEGWIALLNKVSNILMYLDMILLHIGGVLHGSVSRKSSRR
jgi:hypothetical protein